MHDHLNRRATIPKKKEPLAEDAMHELPVVNQQQPAHPGKPQEKFGVFDQASSIPSGGGHAELLGVRVHAFSYGSEDEMAALRSRELNQ